MKDNKYLIINSDNVYIKIHETKISTTDIFNNNNVLEKHKKIILKLCVNQIYPIGDAIELLTVTPFDLTGHEIRRENNKVIITATDNNNLNIFIESELIKHSSEEVIGFYNDLKNSDDLENYIKSLNILFKCNINKKNYEKKLLKVK